jgi:hypothetical protein
MALKLRVTSTVNQQLAEYAKIAKTVAAKTYPVFVKSTPVRTGNARSHTHLSGTTITADYPYADRLDDGYSRQAPRGMTEPSVKAMNQFFKDEFAKLGK